jgi:hypothetical protein
MSQSRRRRRRRAWRFPSAFESSDVPDGSAPVQAGTVSESPPIRSFADSLAALLGLEARFGRVHAVMLLDGGGHIVDGLAVTLPRAIDDLVAAGAGLAAGQVRARRSIRSSNPRLNSGGSSGATSSTSGSSSSTGSPPTARTSAPTRSPTPGRLPGQALHEGIFRHASSTVQSGRGESW